MKRRFLLVIVLSTVLCGCSNGVNQDDYDLLKNDYNSLTTEHELLLTNNNELQVNYDNLQKDYSKIKDEYNEFKESMKPYAELAEADAEAQKAAAELQAEKDRKALEKQKKQEAADKEAAEAEEQARKEEKEKIGYETDITYNQLARTPDDYLFEKVKFNGKVIQVMEGDETVQLRLAVNSDYDNIILCEYDSNIVSYRVLEDDIITIYGVSYGLYSYESTMGGTITIPSVVIDKIDQ